MVTNPAGRTAYPISSFLDSSINLKSSYQSEIPAIHYNEEEVRNYKCFGVRDRSSALVLSAKHSHKKLPTLSSLISPAASTLIISEENPYQMFIGSQTIKA